MKISTFLASVVVLAHGVSSTYLWSELIHHDYVSPDFVRQQRTSAPITDVSSDALRCGDRPHPAAKTLQLSGGAKIGFRLKKSFWTPKKIKELGPVSIYVGIVPDNKTFETWDGSGAQWVKLSEWGAKFHPFTFESYHKHEFTTLFPPPSPSGLYYVRFEQISLEHPGKPKFWVSCAQVNFTNGGDFKPMMHPIPGVYNKYDPGLTVNIYHPIPTHYRVPGPDPLLPANLTGSA
uniref:lytic cellulose monooxygenase (C4-dehydrogenating) n=1 Tax=uncultured eukaryote TaxID=100272 RepID=G8YZS9_9EUKA|nr:putative glycoside hydrolase family 61 [uncultured eukaryote]